MISWRLALLASGNEPPASTREEVSERAGAAAAHPDAQRPSATDPGSGTDGPPAAKTFANDGACWKCDTTRQACDARTELPLMCCPTCVQAPGWGAHARQDTQRLSEM
jgi:hypothetical protein